MTREARKKLVRSRAAKQAENYTVNKYVRELEASLKAAGLKEKEYQNEIERLKKELKTTRSQLKQAKSTNKQLREESAKLVGKYNAAIKGLAKSQKEVSNFIKSKVQSVKMSKEQVFEMYRGINYSHFWDRVLSTIEWRSEHWTEEEAQRALAEAQNRMSNWSSQKIREIIRLAELRSTWYDSDAQWNSSELTRYTAFSLHKLIMSY